MLSDDTDTPDIDALLAQFARPAADEAPTPHAPAVTLAWHPLVATNHTLVRAALDEEGALIMQVLSVFKKYRAMLHIPRAAFPTLRALLDGEVT